PSDSLCVRGQAADVVSTLGTCTIANSAHAFDYGKAGQIFPFSTLVEPIDRVEGPTAPDFNSTVAGSGRLVGRSRLEHFLHAEPREQDRIKELRMIVLDAQDVVGATLSDRACDLGLRAHRLDGHHAALERQASEQ